MTPAPETAPTVLECHALRKAFGAVDAVQAVSLTVAPGEILALLGPSGCGKTTTLRMIAGFERPDGGAVHIAGREMVGPGAFVPPERRRVGMVFQDYALFPHLTVARNIRYGLDSTGAPGAPGRRRSRFRLRGLTRPGATHQAQAARVDELLRLVHLDQLADRYPHELSGGEAQRVALARSLAPAPAVILLDEPFSNLDASLRAAVRAEVREILKSAGAATIFVTHDQEEAFSLADRVAVMWRGRTVQTGTPEAIYQRPVSRAVAEFVGDACFLPGRLADGAVETEIGRLPTASPADDVGPDVHVMLRPERLRLAPAPDGQGEVTSREYFGHDQLVRVRLASGRLLQVRLGPDDQYAPGHQVMVSLAGEALCFPLLRDEPASP